ncbi:L,D-transpeptidase [Actinoplanes sp. DH11]|uniref:L,D-transpeptidase n=1 Tax=Actinoplanes sp. DH11 TaxID=2857011 RepID=UPI001E5ED7BA|nr:L,D-transpeptidase [Actinoplanes sp. DH11]
MPSAPHVAAPRSRTRAYLLILTVAALLLALGAAVALARGSAPESTAGTWVSPASSAAASSPAPAPSSKPKPAAEPPDDLPVITYAEGPTGLPEDPGATSLDVPSEALRPEKRMALYDEPGGEPRAWLPPRISGLPTVAPIVARDNGWVAVLAPSSNRRIGWVPAAGWKPEPLRDHIVVDLSDHRLTWLREGEEQRSWEVSVGSEETPTPLGRTFVMGTTTTDGAIYENLDALVLGTVPEKKENLAASLRGAHTAIHAWSRTSAFGRSVSNGCVRMPAAAQRKLLKEIDPGTPVIVVA